MTTNDSACMVSSKASKVHAFEQTLDLSKDKMRRRSFLGPACAIIGAVLVCWLWSGAHNLPSKDIPALKIVNPPTGWGMSPEERHDIQSLRPSPFGAMPVQTPNIVVPVDMALPNEQPAINHSVTAGALLAAASTGVPMVATTTPAFALSGPPPRSDQRYRVASTWRRVVPR